MCTPTVREPRTDRCHTADIARLIHLNGPPGSGKTSLAHRFANDHPLALVVDIDGLRTNLGQWSTHVESQLLARELAIALIDCHLGAGHDVVVPQFLGRLPFIERLGDVAARHDAAFVEVILTCERSVAVERFRARRLELLTSGAEHPERDVDDDHVEAAVDDAIRLLADVAAARPGTTTIPASNELELTYGLLLAALANPSS